MKANLLLFDLDGTLIDSLGDLAATINLMLRDLDRPPLSAEQVAAFIGNGIPTTVHRALVATHPGEEPPDKALHDLAIETVHRHYATQMLNTTRLFPNVVETLEHFRGKKMGVVTSKEARFTEFILDHFGIAKYFGAIVGGDTTPARKPDPRPVLEALRVLDGPATEAVMIGDSEIDVIAGRSAGAQTCAVTFGYRSAEQLRVTEPDAMVGRFAELREVIE
ncbi:MAG TPA: HAD family hydrolase [Blastocatellia bacterium]|nr:HAD family hydrolase [Blastocatellia bacterium]